MKKHIWITALEKDEEKAKAVFQTASKYGLDTGGHFWLNDLEKMEWSGAAPELLKPETVLWIIAGPVADFKDANTRFGLSLLALMLQAEKGHGFPIIIQPFDGELTADELPTPLRDAEIVKPALLGPKVAAKANIPPKRWSWTTGSSPIRCRAWGSGWRSARPRGTAGKASWPESTAAKSTPWALPGPEDSGKIHPGIPHERAEAPGRRHRIRCLGVKNELSDELSFYVRIRETPGKLLFGEMSDSDDAEVFLLDLQ